jgi:hypothetical protein
VNIYAVGTIGFDFGSEAARVRVAQQMHMAWISDPATRPERAGVQPDPDDPSQLGKFLRNTPGAAQQVTWTLNVDGSTVYALEPAPDARVSWVTPDRTAGSSSSVAVPPLYLWFMDAIVGQFEEKESDTYISRVSLAGSLTRRSVRLISGQSVPVVEVMARDAGRHILEGADAQPTQPEVNVWRDKSIIKSAASHLFEDPRLKSTAPSPRTIGFIPLQKTAENLVRTLLDTTKSTLRNHGQTPGDRALNYLGTNLVHHGELTGTVSLADWDLNDALLFGLQLNDLKFQPDWSPAQLAAYMYTLGEVVVSKSPVDRFDGDCWDINLIFVNPTDPCQAKRCYVFTVDVSDELPVVLPGFYKFIAAG